MHRFTSYDVKVALERAREFCNKSLFLNYLPASDVFSTPTSTNIGWIPPPPQIYIFVVENIGHYDHWV